MKNAKTMLANKKLEAASESSDRQKDGLQKLIPLISSLIKHHSLIVGAIGKSMVNMETAIVNERKVNDVRLAQLAAGQFYLLQAVTASGKKCGNRLRKGLCKWLADSDDGLSASATKGAAMNRVADGFLACPSNAVPAHFLAPPPQQPIQDVAPPVQSLVKDTQKLPKYQGHNMTLDKWKMKRCLLK